MKTLTLIATLALSGSLFAEKTAQQANQSVLETAKKYDNKAELAVENGNDHNANIYTKLAAIKREAAVSKGGYHWDEYHKLTGMLDHSKGSKSKKAGAKDSFSDAAKRYDKLARKATKAGNANDAEVYTRMAEIKREATKSKGNFDWSEYHALEGKLSKPHKKAAKSKMRSNDLIEKAQEHAALANSTNKSGDDYASQIHTRLAAILIDSASKKEKSETIDWSEHDELQNRLKNHNKQ